MSERGQLPHCPLADRDELFTGDDAHYCPLGVELTEVVMRGEVNLTRTKLAIISLKNSVNLFGKKRSDVSGKALSVILAPDVIEYQLISVVSMFWWILAILVTCK